MVNLVELMLQAKDGMNKEVIDVESDHEENKMKKTMMI